MLMCNSEVHKIPENITNINFNKYMPDASIPQIGKTEFMVEKKFDTDTFRSDSYTLSHCFL